MKIKFLNNYTVRQINEFKFNIYRPNIEESNDHTPFSRQISMYEEITRARVSGIKDYLAVKKSLYATMF